MVTTCHSQIKNFKNRTDGFIFSISAIVAALHAVGSLASGGGAIAKAVIDTKSKAGRTT